MTARQGGCLILAGAGLGFVITALFLVPARTITTATYIYIPLGIIIGGMAGALVVRLLR